MNPSVDWLYVALTVVNIIILFGLSSLSGVWLKRILLRQNHVVLSPLKDFLCASYCTVASPVVTVLSLYIGIAEHPWLVTWF